MTVRSVRAGGLNPQKVSEIPATADFLVYGPPKLGKTTFALTAQDVPEMGKYLHIGVERGEETIRDTYPDTDAVFLDHDKETLFERPTEQWDRFEYFYDELRADGHGYGTVCIDTMDALQTINMAAIMENTDSVIGGTQDPDIPSKREYGKSRTQMKRYIRMFQNLPMNVIWVCHSTTEQNERTKRYEKKPMLVGKLQDEVGGMVNNLLYLSMIPATKDKDPQRILITSADGEIQAGTRSRVLNDLGEILDPTMSKVWYPLTGATRA